MTNAGDTFTELFERMPELVGAAVADLDEDALAWRADDDANPIGWLVWHLARVEDDHVSKAAEAIGRAEWAGEAYPGLADRFGLPFALDDVGYGHSSEEVAQVRAAAELLVEYYDAVHAKTQAFLAGVDDGDWDAVVDDRWDPPVTLLVRIASVVNDVTQHVGQAAFVRGLIERVDQAGRP